MNCTNCKAEWTPPAGVSITQCPFCGKSLYELKDSVKNAEPHDILLKIVQRYDKKKLGDTLLKGMLTDLMPHVEKKYQRIFKQALDDRIGAKLLELDEENNPVRVVKINTLKDSFKNNNGFDHTADYVVDCFLFALGWIETVNTEQYSQGGIPKLSVLSQQIDMAFIDGILRKEEAKALFSTAQQLGFPDNEAAEMLDAKIKNLKLVPSPDIDKSLKNLKDIICSCDWLPENKFPDDSISKKKFNDGSNYAGNLKFGLRDGQGVNIWSDGSRYNGEWKNDLRHGKGIMIRSDGDKYEGEWKDDKRNGRGTCIYSNGDKYDGEWEDDNPVKQKTINIGEQIWMVVNLNVDKFRNGDLIPQIQSPEEWKKHGEEKKPAWCYYENNSENESVYGKLYNWWAVNDERGIAPDKWHIPTETEWKTLEKFCGKKVGSKLQSKTYWTSKAGTDDYGFSALPGGYRSKRGKFEGAGKDGYFWSITEFNKSDAKTVRIWNYGAASIPTFENKTNGFSIRCLKD